MTHPSRPRFKLAALVALPMLGLAACAQTPPPQPVTPPPPVVVSTAQEAVGVVRSVDLRTRHVTILTPANRTITLKVPETVQNLDRVRRGNRVRVRFEEAVAVQLTPRGTAIDPSSRWLAVAGQLSNHLTVYAVNPETGYPKERARVATGDDPICVEILTLP